MSNNSVHEIVASESPEKAYTNHLEDEYSDQDEYPAEYGQIELPASFHRKMIPLYFSCGVIYFCSTMSGFDGSLMGSIYTMPAYLKYFDIDVNSSTSTGLVFSINNIGQICGALFCSLMDITGRKYAIIGGCVGTIIGTIITAVAKNTSTLIGGRWLLAFFATIAGTAAPTYCVEISPPHLRGRVAGMYNTLWYIGSLTAAFTAYGTELHYSGQNKSFRIPLWCQMLLPGLVVIFAWFIPESPRWLVGVGRVDEAREIIVRLHCHGQEDHPLVDFELADIESSFEHETLSDPLKVLDLRPLFRTRADRYRTGLVIAIAWFGQFSGNNVCSYYLPTMLTNVGMTSVTTNVLMNGVYSIVCWVASVIGSLVHDWYGRRKMFLFSTLGSAVALSGLAICTARFQATGASGASTGSLVFIYLFGVIFSFAFTPMQPIYPSEVASNRNRSKSQIILSVTSGVASFINQFASPKAMENIKYWFYVFYVFFDLFEFTIVYFFFVETKGKRLEELDVIFEAKNPRKVSVGDYSQEDGIRELEEQRNRDISAITSSFHAKSEAHE